MNRRVLEGRSAVLYRVFDASGALLYIGCTVDIKRRLKEHRKRSRLNWWPATARVDQTFYERHEDALREERRAIAREQPQHNVHLYRCVAS